MLGVKDFAFVYPYPHKSFVRAVVGYTHEVCIILAKITFNSFNSKRLIKINILPPETTCAALFDGSHCTIITIVDSDLLKDGSVY